VSVKPAVLRYEKSVPICNEDPPFAVTTGSSVDRLEARMIAIRSLWHAQMLVCGLSAQVCVR